MKKQRRPNFTAQPPTNEKINYSILSLIEPKEIDELVAPIVVPDVVAVTGTV